MKNNYHIKLTFLKIIIISSFFFYSLLLECNRDLPILKNNECVSTYCTEEEYETEVCIINEPITKTTWLSSIFTIENTNGDIHFSTSYLKDMLIIGSTLSNNEDSIYYGFYYSDQYTKYLSAFNYNNHPYMTINRNENNKLINPEIYIFTFYCEEQKCYSIISIGTNNSNIELLNLENYMNGLNSFSSNDFFSNETHTIIKGVSSFDFNDDFIYIAITATSEEPSLYYLSLYLYQYQLDDSNNIINIELTNKKRHDFIKNKHVDCIVLYPGDKTISCIYLSEDDNYKINLIRNDKVNELFEIKNTFTIESPSNLEENKDYFLKVIVLRLNTPIYCYYSGNENEIPTLLIKKKVTNAFILEDAYTEFPVIKLYDYSFNNDIKYNDLVKKGDEEFYFISTNNNVEFLIVAHIKIAKIKITATNEYANRFVIRYYTIKLQEFYNIKIINGFKATYFHGEYLTLALDFCYFNNCQNPDNIINNTGFIFFPFIKVSNPENYIDFIEYAFNNNKNYLILNLTEGFSIENNIFGFQFLAIIVNYVTKNEFIKYYDIVYDCYKNFLNEEDYENEDYENKYEDENENYCSEEDNFFSFDEPLIKIELTDFSSKEIEIKYYVQMQTSSQVTEFNMYVDKYNDTFGDITNNNFYKKEVRSQFAYYNVNITQNLSTECNDTNCTLCLEKNRNYCIICRNDNYTIINSTEYEFGKIKLCYKVEESTEETSTTINLKSSIINEETVLTYENYNKSSTTIKYESTHLNENQSESYNKSPTTSIYESTHLNENQSNNIEVSTEEIKNQSSTTIKIDNTDKSISETDNLESNDTQTETKESDKSTSNTHINTDELTNENYQTSKNDDLKYTDQLSNENGYNQTDISSYSENKTSTDYLTNQNTISEKTFDSELSEDSFISDKILLEDLLNDKYKDTNLSNEEIKKLYEELKQYIYNKYDGNATIINTGNVNVEISKLDSQQNSKELSSVNLGDCTKILKDKYCKDENNSLVILKFDIKPENEKSTYVQYEIYDPLLKIPLDLKECAGSNAIINVPMDLNPEIETLYDSLGGYGYNLFNSKDSFYNDICAVFTTEDNTDILLYDRRMDIYQLTVNLSLCQEGCEFKSYNSETKKAECDCQIKNQKIKTYLSELEFDKNEMVDEFYETLKYSNFRVIVCYKLVFNLKVFLGNIGGFVMIGLIFLFLILIMVYIFVSSKTIHKNIQSIIKEKYLKNYYERSNKDKNKNKDRDKHKHKGRDKNKGKDKNKDKDKDKNLNKIENKSSKSKKKRKRSRFLSFNDRNGLKKVKSKQIHSKISAPPKRTDKKKLSSINKLTFSTNSRNHINYNNNFLSSNDLPLNQNENEINVFKKRKNKKCEIIRKKVKVNTIYNKKGTARYNGEINGSKVISSTQEREGKLDSKKDKNKFKKEKGKKELNDQEMNSLEYEDAIMYDKRTYCQYYFSLLKKKHLILFTFIPTNDYNLISIKIALFLVSISLYFCINAFFFDDSSMHKIYKNSGVYNIMYRIPQLIYSSAVSAIINIVLKALSLSEKDILKIKEEKDMTVTAIKSKNIEKCLRIKFAGFFIVSLLLMVFFWYYISCFCAVYNNTQIILIKDTAISFGLSMAYPIGLNLLPGFFRIPALRAENKDKICLYSFSKIIAYI